MNKTITITTVSALLISAAIAALTVTTSHASDAGSACKVEPVGTENSANKANSKFTRDGVTVTGKFKVTGKDCNEAVTLASWESPNAEARPLSAQRLFTSTTHTYGAGVHTISVEVPVKKEGKVPGCYFQVDMVKGTKADMDKDTRGAENYGNKKLLGFVLGGKNKCDEPKNHDHNDTDDQSGEGGKGGTPESIAHTGPAEFLSGLFGTSTLAASVRYYLQSRKFVA